MYIVQLYIIDHDEDHDKLLKYRVKSCFLKQLYKSACALFFQDCRDDMQIENVFDFFSLDQIFVLSIKCALS